MAVPRLLTSNSFKGRVVLAVPPLLIYQEKQAKDLVYKFPSFSKLLKRNVEKKLPYQFIFLTFSFRINYLWEFNGFEASMHLRDSLFLVSLYFEVSILTCYRDFFGFLAI